MILILSLELWTWDLVETERVRGGTYIILGVVSMELSSIMLYLSSKLGWTGLCSFLTGDWKVD